MIAFNLKKKFSRKTFLKNLKHYTGLKNRSEKRFWAGFKFGEGNIQPEQKPAQNA